MHVGHEIEASQLHTVPTVSQGWHYHKYFKEKLFVYERGYYYTSRIS